MRQAVAALLFAIACGGSNHNTPDAGPDAPPPDAGLPTFGSVMPQVVLNGSDVIAHPKVLIISFTKDGSNGSDVEQTASQLAASSAWGTMTAEYGVVDLTAVTPQHIAGNIPAKLSDSTLEAMLGSNLGSNGIWGPADPSTIYEFVIPSSTAFDDGDGSANLGDPCCGGSDGEGYTGYHFDTFVGAGSDMTDVPYAVLCECPDDPFETGLQDLTETMSHETVEASTDPRTDADGNPTGWDGVADDYIAWEYGTDTELADMCEDVDTFLWTTAPGLSFALQRSWSNAAAAAGHDPCVGDGAVPYYQTIPEAPDADDIMVTIDGSDPFLVHTHLTKIGVGSSGTVTMHVFADQPDAGPFTVDVEDISGDATPLLDITAPTGTFNPGDAVTFTVKVNGGDANVFSATAEPYVVVTTPAGAGSGSAAPVSTYYYGLVGQ